MAAVTQRSIVGLLASAKINRLIGLGLIFYGIEPRTRVRPVAERLGLALAAGAPIIILACFHQSWKRTIRCPYWFIHSFLLSKQLPSPLTNSQALHPS